MGVDAAAVRAAARADRVTAALLDIVVVRLVSDKYPDALTVSPPLLLVVVVAPLVSSEAQEEVVLLVLGVFVPLGSRRDSGAAMLRQEADHVVS
ncbi:hypothetical protein PC129_g18614 [Phytophthora cactorum]|uniref:Uncharacterized protein n=1 Tax=Phytophthora cactorum TaxID=29920 RepID=A0A329RDT8_9STRA|nr:hypothetical protein Pcac1_g22641 [Phytophthora cactorum]KAG2796382.1 hypothetical protein PC111_g21751 [Phytophthora cactorum]KAG2800410.1 hypothetical protein PC112_g20493 [Phytophthora cactorum]KAG2834448.1 hypothetical protein PC113_g20394 [Phytophthora cactorum]KAG2879538.1 hypothetical protein PC114_g22524 [Phytophthora cactorum]